MTSLTPKRVWLMPLVIIRQGYRRASEKRRLYEIIQPQKVTNVQRSFPASILKPNYFQDGGIDFELVEQVINRPGGLSRNDKTIQGVRKACQVAKRILQETSIFLKPGLSGESVDDFVYRQCLKYSCYPSPLNFDGFPKCVTISTNNVVVHGIPDVRTFLVGDLVTIDVSVFVDGFHGDTAASYLLGKRGIINVDQCDLGCVDIEAVRLLKVTKCCLEEAIKLCKVGVPLRSIGKLIEDIATHNNLAVIPAVCGHSIGDYFHGPPDIIHVNSEEYGEDEILKENMLITLEPALCEGDPDVELHEDGWTIQTADDSRAAQFEHTILILKDRSVILT